VFKNFCFAVAAVVLLAGSAIADDGLLNAADLDVAAINDADNMVVETSLDLDVDALSQKTGDKAGDAVEACFRRWGGWGGYRYGGCYSPCYSYHYYPSYFCYRPVHYYTPCYSYSYHSYPLYHWGCY
jgi:hypothetical protein